MLHCGEFWRFSPEEHFFLSLYIGNKMTYTLAYVPVPKLPECRLPQRSACGFGSVPECDGTPLPLVGRNPLCACSVLRHELGDVCRSWLRFSVRSLSIKPFEILRWGWMRTSHHGRIYAMPWDETYYPRSMRNLPLEVRLKANRDRQRFARRRL